MNLQLFFLLIFLSFSTPFFSQTLNTQKPSLINKEHQSKATQEIYIKILWLDKNNTIQLNENYIKEITNQQRAALGYIVTFIGNECYWDGDKKTDESNLKCKLLTALNLGYQCSDTHLSFLKEWFKEDKKVLEDLQDCKRKESSAKIKDQLIELKMATNKNTIKIIYSAIGIDMVHARKWKWAEKSTYSFTKSEIKQTDRENIEGSFQ
jgi:biopolymer transport protein ExbD